MQTNFILFSAFVMIVNKIKAAGRGCGWGRRRTIWTYQNRSDAMQQFFQHLEAKYGNLPSLIDTGPASETIVSNDGMLHSEHLIRLFSHQATALHVQNYYNSDSAKILGNELIQESLHGGGNNWKVSTSRGLESSDVATLGQHSPYNVAVARDQQLTRTNNNRKERGPIDEYFDGVLREFQSRRRIHESHTSTTNNDNNANYYQLWPLDKLRLEMEESWPSGAGLAREITQQHASYPRPFGGGLPRIMRGPTRWKRGFIHVDELGPLNTSKGLFSANIYLSMPIKNESYTQNESSDVNKPNYKRDAGGLYVWPLGVRSRLDWYRVSSLYPIIQLMLASL